MGDSCCFICRTPTLATDVNSRSFREERASLAEQVEVIFIITKLMNIPSEICKQLLAANGNPSSWIIYCRDCTVIFQKSRKTYEKLITLQKAFRLLKTQLRNYVKVSYEGYECRKEKYIVSRSKKDIPEYLLNLYLSQMEEEEEEEYTIHGVINSVDYDMKFEVEGNWSDLDISKNNDEIDEALIFDNLVEKNADKLNEDHPVSSQDPLEMTSDDLNQNSNHSISSDDDVQMNIDEIDVEPSESVDRDNDAGAEINLDINSEENQDTSDKPKISCEYCGKSVVNEYSLGNHIRKFHTKESSHECPKCGKKFPTVTDARRHIVKAHPKEKKTIKATRIIASKKKKSKVIVCEICGRNCQGDSVFRIHMLRHTGEKPYLCELCSQRFFTVTSLTWHKHNTHYNELNLEPFKCKECGKHLRDPKGLKYHMISHHAERKEFICEICGNEYVDKHKLKSHMKTYHGPQKMFECNVCGEKLLRKIHVEEHRQRHSGIYDFNCEICKKGFTYKKGWQKHMQYHSADFPHKRKSRLTK